MLKRYTFLLFLFIALAIDGFGQILTFEFSALAGDETTASSNSNDVGLSASTISRGSGLTAASNGGRFNATSWGNSLDFSGGDYMEFTITPNLGKKFSVSSIQFQIQRSKTGLSSLALRSSADSYGANLDGVKTVTDNTSTQEFTFTFTLTDKSAPVTFRLYGNAEAEGGSGGIGDFSGNDIVVNGTVEDASVSEPATSASVPVFSAVSQTGFTLSWTNGDGAGRLVLVKSGSPVDSNPEDATDYAVNSIFGLGDKLGTDNYAVYKGGGNSVAITGLTAGTTYHIAVFEYNGSGASINYKTSFPPTGNQATSPLGLTPPTLTADATLNTVDNNIDIEFTDDATWRSASPIIIVNDTTLTAVTDYDLTAGHLVLKPGGGRACLRTASVKTVKVSATGYNDATVSQTINVGAPTGNSTATISSTLALGATRTVTATAKDQYNNLVAGYAFKYDATITDDDATTNESYTIEGEARTASVTDIAVVDVTDASGIATFDITIPATVDENDGISVQVQLSDGTTNIGSAFGFTKQGVQIMISHLSPDYGGSSDEFIVLFNNSNSDFDLNGYELQYFSAGGGTGAVTKFSSSTIIPSKKHRLLSPNATVTVGSVSVASDGSLSSGMATSGQMVLRETTTPANVLYACAWGTVTSYVSGMTDAATWSGDGMISLSPSGTTYTRSDYNASNSQYSHTLSANITNIPNSSGEPLPVELTSFTARAAGSVVNLNWETKTEVDNNGFDVERNSTGTWQKIGFVEGHGTANSPKYYNFTDKSVTGNKIQYRLRQVDNDGTFEYSNVVEVELAPTTFALDQNYPNPFNPATIIRFSLPTSSVVTLNVYNTLGEKVATLLNGSLESGYHQVSFDAANLPSGLYFYEIKAGEFSSIKKMLLMK